MHPHVSHAAHEPHAPQLCNRQSCRGGMHLMCLMRPMHLMRTSCATADPAGLAFTELLPPPLPISDPSMLPSIDFETWPAWTRDESVRRSA